MPDDVTPPAALITPAEKVVVRGAVRTFMNALVPHLPEIAKYAGPAAVGFLLTTAHTWADKAETDKKVEHVNHRAEAGYDKLGPEFNALIAESKANKDAIARLTDTVELQGRLLLASRPGFTPEGKPEAKATPRRAARARRPDPTLVKKVADNATKGLAAIKAAVTEPTTPAPRPVPATLDQVTATPAPQTQVRDAGHSP